MEVLGAEFCDMSPQQLAAPVNTVAVSSEKERRKVSHHECREASMEANMEANSPEEHNRQLHIHT